MTLRVGVALILAAMCWPAAARAQEPEPDTDVTVSPRARLGAGAGYGAPLGAAATVELMYGLVADVREGGDRVQAAAGPLLQVHAGADGGKLSLGVGADARVRTEDFRAPAAAAFKLSLARTWRSRGGGDARTYLGPEIDVSAMHVNLGLGVLARVRGGGGGRVLFSWSLGARF
jgi:hypothetical protein